MSHPPPKPEPTNPDEHAPGMSRSLERGAKRAQNQADQLQQESAEEQISAPERSTEEERRAE